MRKFYFLWTIGFLLNCSSSNMERICNASPIDEHAPQPIEWQKKGDISIFPSAEHYWLSEKKGDVLRILKDDEEELIVELLVSGHIVKAGIRKVYLQDRKAKTRGAKDALRSLIMDLEYGYGFKDTWSGYDPTLTRVKRLTGIDIETPAEWRAWFEENKGCLVWSDRDDRLIIDEEAKDAGIPTEKYRKTHPWPEGQ